jgi:hypothetical protein
MDFVNSTGLTEMKAAAHLAVVQTTGYEHKNFGFARCQLFDSRRLPTGYLAPAAFAREALMYAARLFTGHEILFFGAAALAGRQLDAVREGRLDLDAAPRDEGLERSPLPYPLSQTVTLETILSPEALAARILSPPRRRAGGFAFFSQPQGMQGESSTDGFRIELTGAQSQLVYAVGRFELEGGLTRIPVLLTFKRWTIVGIVVTAVAAPLAWAYLRAIGSQSFANLILIAFLGVGVVGNLIFGLYQRRRLLSLIKDATESREASPQ